MGGRLIALDVATLRANLEIDRSDWTTGLARAKSDLDSFDSKTRSSTSAAGTNFDKAGGRVKEFGTTVKNAGTSAAGAAYGIDSAGNSARESSSRLSQLTESAQMAAASLTGSGSAGAAAGGGLSATGVAASGATRNMSSFAESVAVAAASMDDAGSSTVSAGSSIAKAAEEASGAGSSFGDLAATTVGVSAGLESAADDADVAEGGVSDLSQAADRAKEALGAMGLAASATGLVTFFQQAVMAASDLEESTNAIDTLFGDSAGTIYDFSAGASKSLGIANISAREAAASFGIYGKQANLAATENANFSVKMATLAGDMASFRNTSPEQAIEAIGAAFRGESDPIEAYGVLINETTLKNRAMADGLIASTSDALTPAVRIQAAYNEILAQTSYMQGDFEKTSGSLSNRLKTLRADFLNQSAVIGENLIPVAQGLVSLIAGPGMSAFTGFGSVLSSVGDAVGFLGRVFGDLPGPLQMTIGLLVAMRLAAMLAGSSLGQAFVGRITQATTSLRGFATGAVGATTNAMGALRTQFGYAQQAFRNANGGVQTLGGTLRSVGTVGMSAMRAGAGSLVGFLGGPWGVAFAAATIGVGLWMKKNGEAKQSAAEMQSAVQGVAETLDRSGGQFTVQGQKAAGAALESIKLADDTRTLGQALEDSGISTEQAAKGLAGMESAAKSTREELRALNIEQQGQLSWLDKAKQNLSPSNLFSMGGMLGGYDTDASKQLDAYEKAQAEIEKQQASLKRAAEAGGDVTFAEDGTAALDAMATAMEDFASSTDGAAARVKILSGALAQLQGDALTVDDAMQGWNDTIRTVGADTAGMVGLIDPATGAINTFTEAQSKAYDTAKNTALSLKDVAAATYEQTGSFDAARAAIAPLYDQFVQLAQAAGVPQPEIDALAAKLGMLPTDIVLSLMADDYPHATELADLLGNSIMDIPNDKTIHVASNSPEIMAQVKALGFEVQEMPDGSFLIIADDSQVKAAKLAAEQPTSSVHTIYETRVEALASQGKPSDFIGPVVQNPVGNASGNIIRAYAGGGISDLTAMSGRRAAVVPPNTWRVVGDRARDDEFFIPDTNEPQHVSLGAEWARRRGLVLVDPKSMRAMAGGGLGLGGYSGQDNTDYIKPTNLYEAASLAAGLGFTAVSGVSNLASMASSGQWDLSKLAPQFDTSNNTIPGMDQALSAVTERLDQLISTLQQGGLVQAKIDVDANNGDTGMQLTKSGFA